jgi:GTP-binding protein HflX
VKGECQIVKELVMTVAPLERAFLMGVELKGKTPRWAVQDSLDELERLAWTADLQVVGREYQRLGRIDPATFIGSGKVEELVDAQMDLGFDVVIFDEELLPRQQRELEERFGDGVKVLDRTALILDIFAQHARTREGQLQVELAQYQYRLPRLTRAWTHLARQAGGGAARGGIGGVGLRGPGETQLEVDRRIIRQRIVHIKQELERVRRHRERYRRRRRKAAIPVVSIVGYTNAGKSTLLNALSGANVLVQDKLFATLDPTTRRVTLPEGAQVLFTDTVGFIQKLPTDLVAAFRATLEEIAEADLLLHVIDITHSHARQQSETVVETLAELGVTDQPVIMAFNKIDLLDDPTACADILSEFPNSVGISAKEGLGLDELLEHVQDVLGEGLLAAHVQLPFDRGDLLALFYEQGQVEQVSHSPEGTSVVGRLPFRLLDRFEDFVV